MQITIGGNIYDMLKNLIRASGVKINSKSELHV